MSSSKNSTATVEDRLAEMMIKHMTSHGYKMLNVLRTIGAPTAEGLLGVILNQETQAEETIKQLEENIDSLKEELEDAEEDKQEAIDDAVQEKDDQIDELGDKVLKLQEENKKLRGLLEDEHHHLINENKKLKEQIKQLNIDNELPKTFK